MGYRSDVAIAIAFENTDKLVAFVAEIRLSGDEEEVKALDGFDVAGERVLFYTANDVKWYDSYADVQAIEGILEDAKQRGLPTYRGVVGEDYDDDDSLLWDMFGLERSLRTPQGGVSLKHMLMEKKNATDKQSTTGATQCEPVDGAQVR